MHTVAAGRLGALVFCLACTSLTGNASCGSEPLQPWDPWSDDAGWHPSNDGGDSGTRSLEGWLPYTDYAPGCGFVVPHDPLPPLRWIPCDQPLPAPNGTVCSHAVLDLGDRVAERLPIADVLDDGRVALLFTRTFGERLGTVLVEADGPVRHALVQTGPCVIGARDIHEGKFILRIHDDGPWMKVPAGGAIGGTVDDPRFQVFLPKGHEPTVERSYSIGAAGFVEETPGDDRRYSFEAGGWIETFAGGPGGGSSALQNSGFRFHGEDLFWIGLEFPRFGIHVRPRGAAAQMLVAHEAGEKTRDATSFATDGQDMVWLEIENQNEGPAKERAEIYTAKYTTNPTELAAKKRRLRSDFVVGWPNLVADRFIVGCGYAAHWTYDESRRRGGVRVVRLADGVAWDLFDDWRSAGPPFMFSYPAAITCQELFATISYKPDGTRSDLARVRLDTLGPGILPD